MVSRHSHGWRALASRWRAGIRHFLIAASLTVPAVASAQVTDPGVVVRNDSVDIRLVDVDLRAAVQALSQYLDRPLVSSLPAGVRVTLETPRPVSRTSVPQLLRSLLQSQNFELFTDSGGTYRIRPLVLSQPAPPPSIEGTMPAGPVQLYVIRLRHARAADVAATINALYGRASALGELGVRPSTLSDELRRNRVPPAEVQATQQDVVGVPGGGSATLSGETTIVPDASTNSLLIRANRGDYELIRAAVEQVDVRPLQVVIEVLIAEARRDRSFSFGVDATLPTSRVRGSSRTTVSGHTTGLGLSDFALRVMHIGGVDIDATLRAAAARGDVKIVSRPVVLAANNETAEILVGSQRPFVQVQRALPTDAPIRDQVIQYKDVGTRLTVRPTISSDGYVTLEVTQEVSSATNETAFDAPVISTRSVQTQLLVRDSQTVVLGGLTDHQRDANQGGVPVLSSVPLLGGLFGRASRRSTETELFLFLKPRVIRSDEEAEAVTEPLRERARKVEP